jgi:hypothetical protein
LVDFDVHHLEFFVVVDLAFFAAIMAVLDVSTFGADDGVFALFADAVLVAFVCYAYAW